MCFVILCLDLLFKPFLEFIKDIHDIIIKLRLCNLFGLQCFDVRKCRFFRFVLVPLGMFNLRLAYLPKRNEFLAYFLIRRKNVLNFFEYLTCLFYKPLSGIKIGFGNLITVIFK